jgi:uncharacterized protein
MDNSLIRSKCLRIIDLDQDYSLIYNSLYGNLVKVNKDVIELIDNIQYIKENLDEKLNKTIKYLIEKKFVVHQGDNEYEIINEKLEHRPEKLKSGQLVGEIQLSVSNKCNMNCKYCFEKKFDKSTRDWSQKMDFDTAKKSIENVLDIAKKNGRQHIDINFFGGEPLTNSEVIIDILDYFKSGEKHNIHISYSIDTNGILINEEIAEKFAEYKVLVNLSIDYLSDGIKYRADGDSGATFTQFDKSLKILKEKGVLIYFLTVLSKETFEQFNTNLLDYAKENNVLGNDILLSFDLDFKNQHSTKEIVKKIVEYYVYGREIGLHIGGYWGNIIDQMERVSLRNLEGYKCCPAIGRRLSIEPNGDVFACKSSNKSYGNISDIKGILNSEKYQEYGMRAFRNSSLCYECDIEGFCSGACVGVLEEKYGNITTMDTVLCDIYIELVKQVLKAKYINN